MNQPKRCGTVLFSFLVMLLGVGTMVNSMAPSGESRKGKAGTAKPTPVVAQLPGAAAAHVTPTPTPVPRPNPTPAPAANEATTKTRVKATTTEGVSALSLGAGFLSGRVTPPPTPPTVDLTARGTLDWAHWGMGSPTSYAHKAGVTQQISNFTKLGAAPVGWFSDNPTTFSWTDGTPTASASNTATGVLTNTVGNGFQLTIPADENVKTLRLYVGVWYAQGKLEATLSDGSAPAYVDTSVTNNAGSSHAVYTISFNADSPGQTLTVNYTLQADYLAPNGNVTFEAATLTSGGDPNSFPVVSITSPADAETYEASQNITLHANALDPDGSITKVEFYADGVLLGQGTASGTDQYSFAWNNVFAGNYLLTAAATDSEGGKTLSEPIHLNVVGVSGGALSGNLLLPPSPNAINLTTQGALDWAHWGFNAPPSFTRKSGVSQQISTYTSIGTAPVGWFANASSTFSWTDGTPAATATNNPNGFYVLGAGNGFELMIPADTNLKTLKLYTGLHRAQARLEATLSDGSAPAFVSTALSNDAGSRDGVYSVTFRAASAGQLLRVRYTLLTNYCDSCGNVALKAATLIAGGDSNSAPTVNISAPAPATMFNAPANITISANAADADGSVSKVEFFRGVEKIGEDASSPYSIAWNGVAAGVYSLTAVATDNEGATTISPPTEVTVNSPPTVNAGVDQMVTLPATVTLYGAATDDGFPYPPVSNISWSKVSGPGTVTFAPGNAAVTNASFSSEGAYVLRLTANDGTLTATDDVLVNVYTSATVKLTPTADAHVRDGSSATTNFGTATIIEAQTGAAAGGNRDAYFKFDLSNAGDINSAKLRVFAALAVAGSVSTSVYPASVTSWTETGLNWNNKPPLVSPALDTKTINGTTFAWYEFDVTNYLSGEKQAGRNIVTLVLHNPSASATYIKFNSKEATASKPELIINTPETAFVTGKTFGTSRNNVTGFMGMKFTVGSAPLIVTSLGRIYLSNNTATHTVKLVAATSGVDVVGGSVNLNMAAGVAANGFKYAALPAPVTLAANTAYYIASQETSGGDQWYDAATVLTTTSAAVVNSAVQRPGTTWVVSGGANNSFGPVDFKYEVKTSTPSTLYHLHQEASATSGLHQLIEAGPDTASALMQTADLKGQANGEKLVRAFDTLAGTPGKSGYIPAGSQATFTVWMKNTGTVGTMYPLVKLNLNGPTGPNICTATGAAAITATLAKYTLTCVAGSPVAMSAADRYYLWVGVNLTAGSTTKTFKAELDVEGTLNGNYNSQVVAPLPISPTIYQLSPPLGPSGTSVTISGANFGAMQGTGTVTFNGLSALVSSWNNNSVVAQAPAGASTGPVRVNIAGAMSNGVTFTVGPADSDADGLPDWWELQHFGNLNQNPNDDPDGDGVSNLQEFRQGRNPTKVGLADTGNLINLRIYTPLIIP